MSWRQQRLWDPAFLGGREPLPSAGIRAKRRARMAARQRELRRNKPAKTHALVWMVSSQCYQCLGCRAKFPMEKGHAAVMETCPGMEAP